MADDPQAYVVFCTAPDEEAGTLADLLLDEQLAACVNLLPGVESRYLWQGRRETGRETLLVVKTSAARQAALQERLAAAHSYDVPEILALPVARGLPAYLQWVADCCGSG